MFSIPFATLVEAVETLGGVLLIAVGNQRVFCWADSRRPEDRINVKVQDGKVRPQDFAEVIAFFT